MGHVRGVRVEKQGRVMHLVAYDAGDRHWHELRTCEWRRADPTSETRAGGFAATGSKGVGKELRAAAKH